MGVADGGGPAHNRSGQSDSETTFAPQPHVSAPRGATPPYPLIRRVTLPEEVCAQISWRPRSPKPLAAPRHFDFEACLKRAQVLVKRWPREPIGPSIAPLLSREEAWFWAQFYELALVSLLDARKHLSQLEASAAIECPCDAEIRVWAQDYLNRGIWIYYEAPQVLRPFFSPIELAAVIEGKCAADAAQSPTPRNRCNPEYPWRAVGFARYVAPYLDEPTRNSLRATLERLYDEESGPASDRSSLLMSLLATVGGGERLVSFLSSQQEGCWEKYRHHRLRSDTGQFELLTGLPNEASFVREARRLGCLPMNRSDLEIWLAATQWRALDVIRDGALAMTSKVDARVRVRALALVEAPEAAAPMLQLMAESKAPDAAAQWLAEHPLHAAVGLTRLAMGQGALVQAAREQLHMMRRGGHGELLAAAAQHLTAAEAAWLQQEILEVQEELAAEPSRAELPAALLTALAGVTPLKRAPSWLAIASLPPIRMPGGRLTATDTAIILAALAEQPVGESTGPGAACLTVLKAHADPASLDAFAWRLFELWLAAGGPPQDKWAMWALGCLGGDSCVLKLTPLVRAWPGESQHQRAVFGLTCLRQIGSDTALMALNGIAAKLKFAGLKHKAQQMMEELARSRGLTTDQLADRIVPDCGLDARGSRAFDLGGRTFRFVLGPRLKPQLRDEAGRLRENLPRPGAGDDAVKAHAALQEWQLLKKTVREVLKVQAVRLEEAMISGRRWQTDEFEKLLVRHPLMINLVRLLVLGVYDEAGRLNESFRVTEDQGFADQNDAEIALPPGAQIGVVHPAHLDVAARRAWGELRSDYRIVPPFAQLSRTICEPEPGELQATAITRFRGPAIPGLVLYGMLERSQWLRDIPADNGGFKQHSRHFPAAQLTAFISYSPGLSIGWYEEPQQLEEIYFVPGHVRPEHWGQHDNRLKIQDVDAVVLSEVLRLAHAITSKA